jgi:hypothetical protein
MSRSFLQQNKGKLLATLMAVAVFLPAASASAWWGGYDPGYAGCDPQWAYLEEYGFLDPYGPSPVDWRRLHRDQWRAATSQGYYGGYLRHDPVTRAVRRQCHGWGRPHYYW